VNVNQLVTQALSALPPKVQVLATPISAALTNLIGTAVDKVVHGPRFAKAWVSVNRIAHSQVVAVLTGKGGTALQSKGGEVTLNLGPVVDTVKQQLSGQGFGLINHIPPVNAQIVLFKSAGLGKAKTLVRGLNSAANYLPWIAILCFIGAVFLGVNRRRMLLWVGIGIALSALLLGLSLQLGREVYLAKLPPHLISQEAGAIIFDTMVRFLRNSLRAVFALGLIVALIAFLTGPGTAAVWVRRTVGRGMHALGSSTGVAATPFGHWVGANKRWLQVGVVVIAAAVLIFIGHPTAGAIFVLAIVALFFILLIELIGRPPDAETPPAPDATS